MEKIRRAWRGGGFSLDGVYMTEKSCLAGKFGAFFASIPLPIFAAIYCILYGIVGKSSQSVMPVTLSSIISSWNLTSICLPTLSCDWDYTYPVHEQQFHAKYLCIGRLPVHGYINSSIFRLQYRCGWAWTCQNERRMGNYYAFFCLYIFLKGKYIQGIYRWLLLQRSPKKYLWGAL